MHQSDGRNCSKKCVDSNLSGHRWTVLSGSKSFVCAKLRFQQSTIIVTFSAGSEKYVNQVMPK